jgi:hypothetical protein
MYIPIKIRYNVEYNRYEWCVEKRDEFIETNDGVITFNLYEPIVNYQENNE